MPGFATMRDFHAFGVKILHARKTIEAMKPGVAASRQSAAGCCSHELRRSTETPLRGDGSWEARPTISRTGGGNACDWIYPPRYLGGYKFKVGTRRHSALRLQSLP